MFGNDRNELRQMFYTAWRNFNNNAPLQPLEQMIAGIIQLHPEYHSLLEDETTIDKDFTPEMGTSNPFLHMSMHIAIQEQLSTHRPTNLQPVYNTLLARHQNVHHVEHMLMECLGQMIWQAQRDGQQPDENHYIDCLEKLIR